MFFTGCCFGCFTSYKYSLRSEKLKYWLRYNLGGSSLWGDGAVISVCHVSLSNLDNTAAFHFPGINNQQIEHLKLGTITSYSGLCGLISLKNSYQCGSSLPLDPHQILRYIHWARRNWHWCPLPVFVSYQKHWLVFVSSDAEYSGLLGLIVLRFDTNEDASSLHVPMKFWQDPSTEFGENDIGVHRRNLYHSKSTGGGGSSYIYQFRCRLLWYPWSDRLEIWYQWGSILSSRPHEILTRSIHWVWRKWHWCPPL